MILSDMSPCKRHDTLWLALGFVLQDLTRDSSTQDVAAALQGRLGFPASEAGGVMAWLTRKAAPLVPEASQTGAVVKAYGRYGRRWVWSPRRSGLKALDAVDTQDW